MVDEKRLEFDLALRRVGDSYALGFIPKKLAEHYGLDKAETKITKVVIYYEKV